MPIDVLLPFYGDVNLFKEAVKSVLKQDSQNWHLYILNDAHPDLSVDIWVSDLNCEKITYYRNDSNLGPSLNYKKCLGFATQPYLVIFGADDIMHSNFISECEKAVKEYPNTAILHPKVSVIDQNGVPYLPLVDRIKKLLSPRVREPKIIPNRKILATLMIGDWMYFPSIVWRSEDLKRNGFDPELNVCQDLDAITRILLNDRKFQYLPKEIFSYRRFEGSDSSVKLLKGNRFREEKLLYQKLAFELRRNGYKLAGRMARIHLTSRLHAVILLPKAFQSRDALRVCVSHIFS